mmetsp:Transcript_45366/g.83978  ORF Transcript_45366/g.83978 Transcript_45366/m.83978 type:complete len:313 (+) Transcript_45366:3045-3983(+)
MFRVRLRSVEEDGQHHQVRTRMGSGRHQRSHSHEVRHPARPRPVVRHEVRQGRHLPGLGPDPVPPVRVPGVGEAQPGRVGHLRSRPGELVLGQLPQGELPVRVLQDAQQQGQVRLRRQHHVQQGADAETVQAGRVEPHLRSLSLRSVPRNSHRREERHLVGDGQLGQGHQSRRRRRQHRPRRRHLRRDHPKRRLQDRRHHLLGHVRPGGRLQAGARRGRRRIGRLGPARLRPQGLQEPRTGSAPQARLPQGGRLLRRQAQVQDRIERRPRRLRARSDQQRLRGGRHPLSRREDSVVSEGHRHRNGSRQERRG